MQLNLLDSLAWYIVRIAGLLQSFIAEIILHFYHPNPTKHSDFGNFQNLMSMLYGGMMLFKSKSPYDFPKVVSDRLLWQGRIILLIVVFSIVYTAISVY